MSKEKKEIKKEPEIVIEIKNSTTSEPSSSNLSDKVTTSEANSTSCIVQILPDDILENNAEGTTSSNSIESEDKQRSLERTTNSSKNKILARKEIFVKMLVKTSKKVGHIPLIFKRHCNHYTAQVPGFLSAVTLLGVFFKNLSHDINYAMNFVYAAMVTWLILSCTGIILIRKLENQEYEDVKKILKKFREPIKRYLNLEKLDIEPTEFISNLTLNEISEDKLPLSVRKIMVIIDDQEDEKKKTLEFIRAEKQEEFSR